MIRASKPIYCGFSLFVALTLAPTFPALGQTQIFLISDANAASLPREAAAVRTAGTVIGAALANAGFSVFGKVSDASAGIKIAYAVFIEIRREIILSRASVRIEASVEKQPNGRQLGRIEKKSNSYIRIPEKCTAACAETRLGPETVRIARRLAHGLEIQLRKYSRLPRAAERRTRDW